MDWLQALLLAGLSLGLFATTAAPSLFVGDSAEIAGAAALFGVPHPPGYPVFTALTGLLLRLVPVSDAALAANLVTGFYGACAVAALVLLVRRLRLSRSAASFAALSLATGRTFWSQCIAAEVYSFDVLLLFLALHLLLSVVSAPELRTRWVTLGFLVGLWLGHRPLNLALAPSLLLLLLSMLTAVKQRVSDSSRRLLLFALPGALLALVLSQVLLVLLSRADPWIDVGDPETPTRLWDVFRGAPYQRHFGDFSLARTGNRLERFLAGSLDTTELGLGFYAALYALAASFRFAGARSSPRPVLWTLGSGVLILVVLASTYAVLDIEVFYLPAWALCAVLAAFGWNLLERKLAPIPNTSRVQVAAVLLGLVALPRNLGPNDLFGHKLTRVFAEGVFESLPIDAILIVNGDTSIHCAWFLQGVEGLRPDVAVVSIGHVVPWHIEQLRARHPGITWPEPRPGEAPWEFVRELMLANLESRPFCISPSVNAVTILAPDGERAFEPFPRGVTRQVFYTGQSFALPELLNWNLEFFERVRRQLGPIDLRPDPDSRSTLLQCAASLHGTAQLAKRAGWNDLEARALELCLEYRPDEQEEAIHADALQGLGIRTPINRLGQQARERLAELRASQQEDG